MNEEKFIIRAYGKSELAMLYLPKHSKDTAMKLFRSWIAFNPRLRHLIRSKLKYYTPKQVKMMVEEFGEPFDIE
jgi:hypothetical protein